MPKWREIAKILEVDIEWLLADEERTPGNDQPWLATAQDDDKLPLGLRELLEDEALLEGLSITGLEWSALRSLQVPSSLTKDGYVAVLYALRNGRARDPE